MVGIIITTQQYKTLLMFIRDWVFKIPSQSLTQIFQDLYKSGDIFCNMKILSSALCIPFALYHGISITGSWPKEIKIEWRSKI